MLRTIDNIWMVIHIDGNCTNWRKHRNHWPFEKGTSCSMASIDQDIVSDSVPVL